jgi:hypothetical protein
MNETYPPEDRGATSAIPPLTVYGPISNSRGPIAKFVAAPEPGISKQPAPFSVSVQYFDITVSHRRASHGYVPLMDVPLIDVPLIDVPLIDVPLIDVPLMGAPLMPLVDMPLLGVPLY